MKGWEIMIKDMRWLTRPSTPLPETVLQKLVELYSPVDECMKEKWIDVPVVTEETNV